MSKKAIEYLQEAIGRPSSPTDDPNIDIAKLMISQYLDRCLYDGVKELGADFDLDNLHASIVDGRIAQIVKKLKQYLERDDILPIRD